MDTATRVQILDEPDIISNSAKTSKSGLKMTVNQKLQYLPDSLGHLSVVVRCGGQEMTPTQEGSEGSFFRES